MPLHKVENILSYAESEESFFERIKRYHSPYSEEYTMIARAYNNAMNAFSEIYRDRGEPYYTHVRAVAILMIDYLYVYERVGLRAAPHEIITAALLHDNPEDRPDIWPLERVERDYNCTVALMVDYVSKRPRAFFGGDERKQLDFFHCRLKFFHPYWTEVMMIKLADRLHNQMTLWTCDFDKIKRKMRETNDIYLPLARKSGILIHELEETTVNFEERLAKHKEVLDANKNK